MNNDIYLVPKDELYHYGVKGMKWGVRKAKSEYASRAGRIAFDETMENTSRIGNSHYKRVRMAERARAKAYKKAVKEEKRMPEHVKKSIEESFKSGRLRDMRSSDVWGIRQKNGDILFVDANDVRKLGVDAAEKKTLDYVKEQTAKRNVEKGKKFVEDRMEEKALVEDMIKTYDKNDPDYDEAMSILKEMYDDFD